MAASTLLAIACGGALGAMARHGVNTASLRLFGPDFPWGTLGVNILGSFFMGALIAVFAHIWHPPQDVKSFLATGVLGAFTTFSTFSLDFVTLYDRGEIIAAGAYAASSVIFAIIALMAGLFLVRTLTV